MNILVPEYMRDKRLNICATNVIQDSPYYTNINENTIQETSIVKRDENTN